MTLLLSAALAVLAGVGPAAAQDGAGEGKWDARLASVSGGVAVHPADGSSEVAGEEGMLLEEGDRVSTSAGASAEISLDDGGVISLQENSDFTLERAQKSDSSFFLSLGSLLAKIESLGERRLSVRTPSAVAAVRGTEFAVEVEDAEQSHVGVFDEGRVEVRTDAGSEVLEPRQETSVRRGRPPLKAAALKRFLARRELMLRHRARLQELRKRWKALPPEKRRALRAKAMERLRERRQDRREKVRDLRRRLEEKRQKRLERRRGFREKQ